MYAILVVDCGLSPDYVLDKMAMYEVEATLEGLQYRNRESWEQTRMVCYMTAQANSTKKLTPLDILKFPWDCAEAEHETSISSTDVERLKNKAEQYLKSK